MKPTVLFAALLLLLFVYNNPSFSQYNLQRSSCKDIIRMYCKGDLSVPVPGLIIDSLNGSSSLIYGKHRDSLQGYMDVLYANDKNRICDTLSSSNTFCQKDPGQLKYSIYYPTSLNGSKITCALPFIVMFHGGSFFECSSKDNNGIRYMCRELAKRGFVVFSPEYRRGVLPDPRLAVTGYQYLSAQQLLANYRACQDARGAIRTIIYRQRINQNGADFLIDTNLLFVGGISAGSLIAMNAAFYERQGQVDSSYNFAGAVLGDIDAPYYYGDTSINFFSKLKGVVNMWGGVNIHKRYWNDPEAFFNSNSNQPALISFQGEKDPTFYIGQQYLYFSADSMGQRMRTNFNTECNCLVNGTEFSLDKNAAGEDAVSLGADALYTILRSVNVPAEVYIDSDMAHGIDECDTCRDNSYFTSDFGTGYKTRDEVYSYIAGRTASFFGAVMNGLASKLTRTRFLNCENRRVRCVAADNSECEILPQQQSSCDELAL